MRNLFNSVHSLWSVLQQCSNQLLIGSLVVSSTTMGILPTLAEPITVKKAEPITVKKAEPITVKKAEPIAATSVSITSSVKQSQAQSTPAAALGKLPDGVYLYGQSPEPEKVGQGYFVFEVKKGQVVGALYMPRSSFDCASGNFQADQLALTVVNSYDRTTNPFEIALERNYTVASGGNPAQQQIGLQGFYQLSSVSKNDYRMLNICKSDLQKQARK